MSKRRLRPVAALTLAIVAAPFLAATAVAAQAKPAPAAADAATTAAADEAAAAVSVAWPTTLGSTPARVLAAIQKLAPPAPPVLGEAVRATPPPPPPVTDPATWIWPGAGPITSPFGSRWGRMHEGVDIDAAYGSAVVAAQRGTVITAGWGQSGYGRVVEIDHGFGLVTRYAHLSSIAVTAGQVIEQGTNIGAVGASGAVTAAHLHYEVRENGVARNPTRWLPAGGTKAGNPG
jgi:murein DD-endopeptidase MepM/ murein hydrolase activator NlpD